MAKRADAASAVSKEALAASMPPAEPPTDTLNKLLFDSPLWKKDWEPHFGLDLERATPAEFAAAVEEFEAWAKTQPQDKLPLQSGWYDCVPQFMELLLIRNSGNRKPALSVVKRYWEYMKNDDWQRTGETIVVNDHGRGMNLQHRGWASYYGRVSFPCYIVANGVSNNPKLFAYYDNGKTRTLTDVIRTAGFNGHANVMGKSVLIGHDYDSGAYKVSGKKITRAPMPYLTKVEVIDYIENHDDLEPVASAITSDFYRAGVTLAKHKEVCTFVAYRQLRLYGEDKMDEFWTGLSNPSSAPEPVAQLHDLLLKNLDASELAKKHKNFRPRFGVMTTLAYLIRASNAFVLGEDEFQEVFKLADEFPQFVEAVEDVSDDDDEAEAA